MCARLATGLENHARAERDASGSTAFIDGGYFAVSAALRDSDDIGAPVILDGDVLRFKDLKKRNEPTDGLQLTVPKKHARTADGLGLPPFLKVADSTTPVAPAVTDPPEGTVSIFRLKIFWGD